MAQAQKKGGKAARESMRDGLRGAQFTMGMDDDSTEMMEQMSRRFQSAGMEAYSLARDAMALNMRAMNRLIGCRTIGEMTDVQRDYFKEAIDTAFESSRRLYGMTAETAEEIADNVTATLQEVTDEANRQREEAAGGRK